MQVPFICFVLPSVKNLVKPSLSARGMHIMNAPLRQARFTIIHHRYHPDILLPEIRGQMIDDRKKVIVIGYLLLVIVRGN
jgi:hypothetical protein